MKKVNYIIFFLINFFILEVVFANNEIIIKDITPIYDTNSSIIETTEENNNKVIFNDKNQIVKYKLLLENTSNYNITLSDISISTPQQEFLKYQVEKFNKNEILNSNSVEEVIVTLETISMEGWGKNFNEDLTATITLDNPVLNPNTSTKEVLVLLIIVTTMTIVLMLLTKKNKITRYVMLAIYLTSTITVVKALSNVILEFKVNVSYESQNVIEKARDFEKEGTDGFKGVDFWAYRNNIKNIYIANEMNEITKYAYKFDVSENKNNKVIAYLVEIENDPNYYNLYIQSDGVLYANQDASYYFYEMHNLESINNLEKLDTSNTTSMVGMFYQAGYSNPNLSLDLKGLNTSNVTDMSNMFQTVGYTSNSINLDLSEFDTSKVTDMKYMFTGIGFNTEKLSLDLSNFDTGEVLDMSFMFNNAGYNSKEVVLNVSNLNTSKVENMRSMFNKLGGKSSNVTLDVSNFNTSSAIDMSYMFMEVCYSCDEFTLDVSNFDTKKVTTMRSMFYRTATNCTSFTLDLSKFDTRNVTNTRSLLSSTGTNSNNFITSLTITNPNTTVYNTMFSGVAQKGNSKVIVNYTSETSALVDKMIATKSASSNVVKGEEVIINNTDTSTE